MWFKTATLLSLLFATFYSSNAFNQLTPWDKETVYSWRALIKAGTDLPQPHASQFALQGKIHLQSSLNSTHVKITDLSYQLYNGILNHDLENQSQDIPLPPKVKTLENTFQIVYSSEGLVEEIVTQAEEEEWSRNIKRGIATVFQLNKTIVNKKYHHQEVFVVDENSIYGRAPIDYNIFPRGELLEVHKLHDMRNSDFLYSHISTNVDNRRCDAKYENVVMHDSIKKYYIIKENDKYIVNKIVTVGSIVYYPFGAKSDSQFIEIRQEFDYSGSHKPEEKYTIESAHPTKGLTYRPYQFFDIPDNNKLFSEVQNMLDDIPKYLKEDHIQTKEPDSNRGQLINRLQQLLTTFDTEKLEELRKTLNGSSLDAFYHLLPAVATNSSIIFIKNLVVSKTVNDDIAVNLLQHLHDIMDPSVDPLSELEELLHLNDTFSWAVRKVAILNFGNVIHKRYKHDKNEKTYEKYVIFYLNQLKSVEDYRIKMVYLLGLKNMKLPILLKYLQPPFNDNEIFVNHHLRFLGLMTVGPIIQSSTDPNLIMETLWPILTNPDEYTELRILAYNFFMQSKPTHSRLRNLLFYLLTEKDQELYHYHYTYLQELMLSTDPCNQNLRVQAAQLMKFTPPPSQGISSATYSDYTDVNFGFGAKIEKYFISSNNSRYYSWLYSTQNSNIFQDEYMIYLKIHESQKSSIAGLTNSIFEVVFDIWVKALYRKYFIIEAAVFKRDQVVDVFYFDRNNFDEVAQFFEDFSRISINYDWYHKTLIPTDLGIPGIWEVLGPSVHKRDFTWAFYESEKPNTINYRHVIWSHYHNGLKFYNPFVNVWQGINRIQAYDAVLPIIFDYDNPPTETLKLSWKQANQTNFAGIRSHVKQVVFVVGYVNNFKTVSSGKQFRNNYTLIDHDDLATGHKWYMGVYDSDRRISNGSFNHQMGLFLQPHTKHFSSPLDYLFLAVHNCHRFLFLMPNSGNYGFVFRVESSREYNVTGIDIDIDVDIDSDDDISLYMPQFKFQASLAYTVKDEDRILKKWSANASLEANSGHTVFNNELVITQEPENYIIKLEGVKKFQLKKVTGHVGVILNNQTIVDVDMEGKKSLEQQDGHYRYENCQYFVLYSRPHFYTLDCIISRTTFRHYSYDIKTKHVPQSWKDYLNHWWEFLKGQFYSYYSDKDSGDKNISEGEILVSIDFPIQTHELDAQIRTPKHIYEFSGVPRDHLIWFGIAPDSPAFSRIRYHKPGSLDQCFIYSSNYSFNGKITAAELTNNFTLYYESRQYKTEVYVKKSENSKLAVRVENGNNTLDIIPNEGAYQIVLDEAEIPLEEENTNDWVYIYVFEEDPKKTSFYVLKNSGIHLEYDSEKLIVIVSVDDDSSGKCLPPRRDDDYF